MVPERAQNYNQNNFDQLFEKFDEDKNGFIEKNEMVNFIKQTFRVPQADKAKIDAKFKGKNNKSLAEHLGDYNQNIKANIDQIWVQFDYDGNNALDKTECKDFLNEL